VKARCPFWSALTALLLSASCMSGSPGAPVPGAGAGEAAELAALQRTLNGLESAVNAKDLNYLRETFSSLFRMDGNVGLRFYTSTTTADTPSVPDDELVFFNSFFEQNENIQFRLTASNTSILGSVATVSVQFLLSATYVLEVPPLSYQAEASDLMVFVAQDGRWKLTSWRPDPTGEDRQTYERQRILDQLAALVDALNARQLDEAAALTAPWLNLDEGVQRLFRTQTTLSPGSTLPEGFQEFFSEVFAQNQDLQVTLSANPFYILGQETKPGDRVSLTAYFSLAAVYTGGTGAPEAYSVEAELHELVFEMVQGSWLLATWRRQVAPPPQASAEALRARIAALAAAISAEDVAGLDSIASGLLTLNSALALRFRTTSTLADPPAPGSDFSAFFEEVFAENENLLVTLDIISLQLNGTVADCTVSFSLAATYLLTAPTEDYCYPEEGTVDDSMVWEFDGSSWRLAIWQPAPGE